VSRFLFVVPPLFGHANAASAVAGALAGRGHEVAWCGPETFFRPLLGPGATIFPTGARIYREQAEHGLASVMSVWQEYIIPQARFTLPAADRAVRTYQPDLLVADQIALAGALAARQHGLRWATLIAQALELTEPLRAVPGYTDWVHDQMVALCRATDDPACADIGDCAGIGDREHEAFATDLRFSPHLVIAFTTEALTGKQDFPEHFALVGPALGPRPAPSPWDYWDRLDLGRRKLLVTVGTLATGLAGGFYQRVADAVAPLRAQLQVIVVGPAEALPDPPENVLVTRHVPMLELLPKMDAVISHGGMNTVCEALAYGIPLVIAPIRHDQPVMASQVTAAGAGIRVRFSRDSPSELRRAVLAVLSDPAYRAAAGRIRDSFATAGGAPAAAARLERLAAARPAAGDQGRADSAALLSEEVS
jgi:zeaxanthin glucosyltransferase